MSEQLTLDMPFNYEVGQFVWWTSGLKYLCMTYKKNGKLRAENVAHVKIKDIFIDESNAWLTKTFVIESLCGEVHTVDRWLSPNEAEPCRAVREAYEIWGN